MRTSASIDGGIFFGVDPTSGVGRRRGAELDRLARFGVDAALAAPFRAGYFDVREGNDELLEVAAADSRIVPVAVVNPASYDSTERYLRDLAGRGAKAIGLFPHLFFESWGWSNYVVERIARDAAEAGLAIQVGLLNAGDLADVARYLAPAGCPVLVRWMRGSGYNLTADIVATGRDFPNLYFDVGTTTQSGGIDFLVSRLGANRLFVASNAPLSHEGCAHFAVEAAMLSPEDRVMIRGGTLAQVLRLNLPGKTDAPHSLWDDLLRRPKIDTHWHTSGWNIVEPRLDFRAMSEEFDRFNYRIAVTSSVRALNDDLLAGNAETRAFCDADPRVRGYVVVNPLRIEDSLAELHAYSADPRFVGVKTIQDFYGLSLSDAAYAPLLECARDLGMTVMAHMEGMADAARRFPDLNFIASHGTWRPSEFRDLPNVYMDIATSTPLKRQADISGLIDGVGVERVVFSCDGQLMSPAWTLGKLASIDLSDAAITTMMTASAIRALPRLSLDQCWNSQ